MLDDVIIDWIKQKEKWTEKPARRDSGWQPIPLYEEMEVPRDDSCENGTTEVDIWGPQKDTIVDNNIVTELDFYSPTKYFIGFW